MFEKANIEKSYPPTEEIVKGGFLDKMNEQMLHHPIFRNTITAATLLSLSSVAQAKETPLPDIDIQEQQILQSRALRMYSPHESDHALILHKAGKLKEYFSNTVPEESGNYNVHREKDVPQELLATYAKSIYQGTAMAEYSLGFDPGSIIKNFHFVSSEYSNAGVDNNGIGKDHSIMMTTAQIQEAENGKYDPHFTLRNTSHHEAIHALDYHLGLTDIFDSSRPSDYTESNVRENAKMYSQFSNEITKNTEFMHLLAEGNFFSDDGIHPDHGHPQDNGKELFATFLTTTSHTNILDQLDQVEKEHPGFKDKYSTLTQKVADLLSDKIENDTPIMKRLSRIIEFLKQK